MSVKKSGRSKARARVAWDEDNLDYLEANKSPKKKITEPKTPYHAPEASDGMISPLTDDLDGMRVCDESSSVDPEAVTSALLASSSSNGTGGRRWRRSSGWTSSEDETEDRRDDVRCPEEHQRFAELRRAHYDEFRRLQLLRLQGSSWQEEEEEQAAANGSAGGDGRHNHQQQGSSLQIQANTKNSGNTPENQ
ncbi:protein phosphatase inhibitor 2 isoform X1 [Selaginella moellendorffii]|uniref:protein phosphatase inhibitor 2 isoform X1 n=1 Tax=Selaginella moellendorffii TaxID=88036 RepID=UPI000D1CF470|nr:protein phosphatase inhibitor 2 isoform X1 [Selaginella moellendorffii]|eukprot:XP_024532058.1 protein phosphatase inhibitor 2 isoform X1 [Selaginella moellendorffii]